jgi:CO dehydrogenase maturation factor
MVSWTLAITGKGGVGKSTLAALAVRWLVSHGRGPVLAVDADHNTCLDALLGVRAAVTVGGVREEAKRIAQAGSTGGMGKSEILDLKIQEALVEADGFDLVAMGRPEGPGCYCYANNVLRQVLGRLAGNYPAVVIDNEAGLENLSRRTVQTADWLVFVAEPSQRGLDTARRLHDLSREMEVKASHRGVVVNRLRNSDTLRRAEELFAGTGVAILGGIPEDATLAGNDEAGRPVFDLPDDNPALLAADQLCERMSQACLAHT